MSLGRAALCCGLAIAVVLVAAPAPAAVAQAPPRPAAEAVAKRVASRFAAREGYTFPASMWFARCTRGRNLRGCYVSSNDAPPAPGASRDQCKGTMRIYRRGGRLVARRIDLSCENLF